MYALICQGSRYSVGYSIWEDDVTDSGGTALDASSAEPPSDAFDAAGWVSVRSVATAPSVRGRVRCELRDGNGVHAS